MLAVKREHCTNEKRAMVNEYSAIDWETEVLISGFVIVLLLSVFCLAAAQKMEKIARSTG